MYTLDGTNEIAVFGDFSLNNILTEHYGAMLAYEHNFGEYFGIELMGGGGYGGLTSLANTLRQTDSAFNHNPVNDLSNSGALQAFGQIGVRLTPFYGKFNLASELPVHFDMYLVAGIGVAYVTYTGILDCAVDVTGSPATCPGAAPTGTYYSHSNLAPAFNGGGGMRLFVNQLITIRVEVRDMVFPDSYQTGINLRMPQETRGVPTNPFSFSQGLTQVPLFFVGLGFLL